jgi:hypothetical protein
LRPGSIRADDLATAASAVVAIVRARWVLKRGGFPRAVQQYGLQPEPAADVLPGPLLPMEVKRAARVSYRVLRLPLLRGTCLPTSLALAQVLEARGLEPVVVLGVAKADAFAAHAWVEAGGRRFDVSGLPAHAYRQIGRFALPGRG